MVHTSEAHPLHIAAVAVPHGNGIIGMAFCPGEKGISLDSGVWNRNLDAELAAMIGWGADALVTLGDDHDLALLKTANLHARVERAGRKWLHLPIADVGVPCDRFEEAWIHGGNAVRGILAKAGRVVLHCRGDLDRTGWLAARLLVDFGLDPDVAITQVRAARPGAIEGPEQSQYVKACKTKNPRRNLDHYLGSLVGGAIGDALGAAVEFEAMNVVRSKYGPSGIQFYAQAYGRRAAITDDTQMTLFTAEGLLRATTRTRAGQGIVPSMTGSTYRAYQRWLATQGELPGDPVSMDGWLIKEQGLFSRRAPGNTCLAALKDKYRPVFGEDRSHNRSKGCGAVMRAAPVGLFYHSPYMCGLMGSDARDEQSFTAGRDVGYLTHGHPSGYLPAASLAMLIGRIIEGDGLNQALDATCRKLAGHQDAEETLSAINLARKFASDGNVRPCPETLARLGAGWTGEEALAIAVYCALVAGNDFDFSIRLAVNHAGDSDSTGAMTGNIMGALHGRRGIADYWLGPLELRSVIEQIATDLFLGFQDDEDWAEKYPGH